MNEGRPDLELHEMIFAHQIGVDGNERFVVQLLHVAKQLLYMLPGKIIREPFPVHFLSFVANAVLIIIILLLIAYYSYFSYTTV